MYGDLISHQWSNLPNPVTLGYSPNLHMNRTVILNLISFAYVDPLHGLMGVVSSQRALYFHACTSSFNSNCTPLRAYLRLSWFPFRGILFSTCFYESFATCSLYPLFLRVWQIAWLRHTLKVGELGYSLIHSQPLDNTSYYGMYVGLLDANISEIASVPVQGNAFRAVE